MTTGLLYYYFYLLQSEHYCQLFQLILESGEQPVVKGLTEYCTMTFVKIHFFSIQVPVLKSLLSPIKLFFIHVLLSSQSQLLQYTFQSQLILYLIHLELLGYNYFLHAPHSCNLIFKRFIFLNLSYFHFVQTYISRYGKIYDLNFLLVAELQSWYHNGL